MPQRHQQMILSLGLLSMAAGCLDWEAQWPGAGVDSRNPKADASKPDSNVNSDSAPASDVGMIDSDAAAAGDAASLADDGTADGNGNPIVVGCANHRGAVFCEDLETGTTPFSFDNQNGSTGQLLVDCGTRGRCWKETLSTSAAKFGLDLKPRWPKNNKIYIRAFIRYGDSDNVFSWRARYAGGDMFYFPMIALRSGAILVKHHAGSDTSTGQITISTPNGQTLPVEVPLQSNQWYCLELMLEDNGTSDNVKVWVDRSDEERPTAQLLKQNMFQLDWTSRTWTFGSSWSSTQARSTFYFDDVVINTRYIGCSPP